MKEIFSEIIDVPLKQGYQVIKREVQYNGDSTLTTADIAALKELAAKNGNNNSNNNNANPCDTKNSTFQLFFKYNKREIDMNAADFKTFIDQLAYSP